jgi:hypothetical protein
MFGKVNPAPAVSKSIRMMFWTLLEPPKPPETSIHESKNHFNENTVVVFLTVSDPIGLTWHHLLPLGRHEASWNVRRITGALRDYKRSRYVKSPFVKRRPNVKRRQKNNQTNELIITSLLMS